MIGGSVYRHCLQNVPGDVQRTLALNLWRRSVGLLADDEFDRLPPPERAEWYFQAGERLPRMGAVLA